MDQLIAKIYQGVLDGNKKSVIACVEEALQSGLDVEVILNDGLIAPMTEVGRLFEEGEYFVPEMLVSARAMQAGLEVLKPAMKESNVKSAGTVVAGTVKGDMHDIGKNLVCMMLEGAGYTIRDLGTDVAPEQFVAEVSKGDVDIVALSALLTTTMPNMKTTIDALKQAGVRDRVKIIVGGAPLTDTFASEIGADGFASDASRAVRLARSFAS
ncbi:methyltransferase [Leptolinea tardivitalis]|uniref:Methyltransferase n=2 Tax=Leptolinea tardivitalis TaxID=229920 RepID=A0A0P6XCA6_9CHLR|nr:methyltransferase [Leptolinea tardivitalis]GAP20753.1 predicted cobalamin binding protein [Leptolinea tardivitalis]